MDFKERLNALRIANGYTLEELGKRIGVGKSAISNYESGYRTPKIEHLEALADLFNVDLDYLTGRSDVKNRYQENYIVNNTINSSDREGAFSSEELQYIKKYRALDSHGHQVVTFLLNAEYDRVQDVMAASRGEAVGRSGTIAVPLLQDALSRREVGTIPVQADGEIQKDEDDLIALPVTNDAMAPFVHPGDKLIVRQQPEVDSGDIAVVLLDGMQVVCKQVIKEGDNLRLVPLNKKYEDMVIHKEDIRKKRFEIIGRVVKSVQAS